MMPSVIRLPVPAALVCATLLLSACGSASDPAPDTPGESRGAQETASSAVDAATPATEATPAATSAAPNLSAYVGKYPFDEVEGVTFKNHPAVQAGLAKTVTNARIRTAITTTQGPSAPIAMVDGKVAAWSCQQHNCSEHQWAILIDPATGATDVCYQNDPAMVSETRWFLANGQEEKRKGNCSVE